MGVLESGAWRSLADLTRRLRHRIERTSSAAASGTNRPLRFLDFLDELRLLGLYGRYFSWEEYRDRLEAHLGVKVHVRFPDDPLARMALLGDDLGRVYRDEETGDALVYGQLEKFEVLEVIYHELGHVAGGHPLPHGKVVEGLSMGSFDTPSFDSESEGDPRQGGWWDPPCSILGPTAGDHGRLRDGYARPALPAAPYGRHRSGSVARSVPLPGVLAASAGVLRARLVRRLASLAYREFGEPRNESEAPRKRRFAPLASGGVGWTLLYLLHFLVPLAALLWPDTPLGRNPISSRRRSCCRSSCCCRAPTSSSSWAHTSPSNLYLGMCRFTRYNRLTQALSFRIKGHAGNHWMVRYKYAHACRLIERACHELGLPPQTSARAATTYAIAAVARAGNEPGARTLPPYDAPMDRSRLRELYDLHNRFLREPEGSPRRYKALENT